MVGGLNYQSSNGIYVSNATVENPVEIISSMHYHNTEYMLTLGEDGKFVCIFVGGNGNSDWLVSRGRGFYAINERWFTHSINQESDSSPYLIYYKF